MFVLPGFPADTPLVLYEEIKPDFVEKINNYNDPLEKVLLIINQLFEVLFGCDRYRSRKVLTLIVDT